MADLIDIDDDNFKSSVMEAPLPVLVDCWAAWCGPCRMLEPEIEAVARRTAGRLSVVKLDTDAQPRLARALGVRLLPTMVLFTGGVLAVSIPGYRTCDDILKQVEPFLGAAAGRSGAGE